MNEPQWNARREGGSIREILLSLFLSRSLLRFLRPTLLPLASLSISVFLITSLANQHETMAAVGCADTAGVRDFFCLPHPKSIIATALFECAHEEVNSHPATGTVHQPIRRQLSSIIARFPSRFLDKYPYRINCKFSLVLPADCYFQSISTARGCYYRPSRAFERKK